MKKILKTPLLPMSKATVAVSEKAENIIDSLKKMNIEVLEIPSNPKLEPAVSSHADCNILQLDENNFVCDESVAKLLIEIFKKNNIVNYLTIGWENKNKIINGSSKKVNIFLEKISSPYQSEVSINTKRINNGIVGNSKYISDIITEYAKSVNLEILHCNQGYVGCSSVLINDNAIMTDDESVYSVFNRIGFDCLMLSKGQIKLSGHSYGFIGGTCGFIDKNLIAFSGRIDSHNDADKIRNFLNKYKVKYIELTDEPLTDIGGIVPILEKTDDC